MALATYDDLVTAIAAWIDRTDMLATIPDWITLCEAQIARRLRRSVVRESIIISTAATTLPTALAELRSARLITTTPTSDRALYVGTPEMYADWLRRFPTTGRPRFATIVNAEMLVAPVPDQDYECEIIYWDVFTPISVGAQTSATLAEAPDLYLYGALQEAAPYLEHDERVPLWTSKFEAALASMNALRERAEYNASLMPVRLPVVF